MSEITTGHKQDHSKISSGTTSGLGRDFRRRELESEEIFFDGKVDPL